MIKISVCIPAYNRSKFLQTLLESIHRQSYINFEVLVCEDFSPERDQIVSIIKKFNAENNADVKLYLNQCNLGYDGNIRELVCKSTGDYCFFMGNDDLMVDGALTVVAEIISNHPDVKYVLRSYGWFIEDQENPVEIIRYFSEDRKFVGTMAARVGIRRAGVISGFIVERESAIKCSTNRYDGSLYYQIHLAANALKSGSLYYVDKMLTLSRNGVPPDFGASSKESKFYTPGVYTSKARIQMVSGAMQIVRDNYQNEVVDLILRDYARHFYPYIKDQLHLRPVEFFKYYLRLGEIGFNKFISFHLYCLICYGIGERMSDRLAKILRCIRQLNFERVATLVTK